jgi:hypothetical protein
MTVRRRDPPAQLPQEALEETPWHQPPDDLRRQTAPFAQ